MKIGDSPKTAGAVKVERSRARETLRVGQGAGPNDQLVIAGVPESDLTPKVREALMTLMNEVQSLRAELAQTRERTNSDCC